MPPTIPAGRRIRTRGRRTASGSARTSRASPTTSRTGSAPATPDARLLVIGGDCTSHAGAMAGLRRARPGLRLGLVWFDAHGDFNVPDTTPSGNVWGMPFAMACGRGEPDLLAACDAPTVREADAALLGGQVLDEQESRMLAVSAVAQFGAGMLADPAGLAALRGWAATVAGRIDGWYVAFDMDALDEAGGWAVMMPEPGGLSLETALEAVRIVAATGRCSASGRRRSGSGRAAIPSGRRTRSRPSRRPRWPDQPPTTTRSEAMVRNSSSDSPVPLRSQLGLEPRVVGDRPAVGADRDEGALAVAERRGPRVRAVRRRSRRSSSRTRLPSGRCGRRAGRGRRSRAGRRRRADSCPTGRTSRPAAPGSRRASRPRTPPTRRSPGSRACRCRHRPRRPPDGDGLVDGSSLGSSVAVSVGSAVSAGVSVGSSVASAEAVRGRARGRVGRGVGTGGAAPRRGRGRPAAGAQRRAPGGRQGPGRTDDGRDGRVPARSIDVASPAEGSTGRAARAGRPGPAAVAGTVSRTAVPAAGNATVSGALPVAERDGQSQRTGVGDDDRPASDRPAAPPRPRGRGRRRAVAVSPPGQSIAASPDRELGGELRLEHGQLLEGPPLGGAEVGLAPAPVDRDRPDAGSAGDRLGGRERPDAAGSRRSACPAPGPAPGRAASRSAAASPASSSGGSLRPQ